jgi:hypothetical protein
MCGARAPHMSVAVEQHGKPAALSFEAGGRQPHLCGCCRQIGTGGFGVEPPLGLLGATLPKAPGNPGVMMFPGTAPVLACVTGGR